MGNLTFNKTSEAVSTGHPDKVADQIADSIFDLLRTYKNNPQSAVEVSCGANILLIFGEIDKDIVGNSNSTIVEQANPQLAELIKTTAQKTIQEIGYTKETYNPTIILDLVTQSTEINKAVEETATQEVSAGDQGIVSGYAIAETKNHHAAHFILAHEILKELETLRKTTHTWLNPDAKSQITINYTKNKNGINEPTHIKHILLSHCHTTEKTFDKVQEILKNEINNILTRKIKELITSKKAQENLLKSLTTTEILINPAGAWHNGGPRYDSGLTGRKLVVDNYGSSSPIGGGATSGKNLGKVDRSGAYYARNIAKTIVASGLAHETKVELSFAIGIPEPTSINIETFGTETIPLEKIYEKINKNYTLNVKSMIELSNNLDKFIETSKHGNYTNNEFPWEKTIKLT